VNAPLVTLDNVTLGYERHPAVHHLGGAIERGAMLAVVGPNGGGKSTLIAGLAGQMRPMQGSVDLHGLARRGIAVMPQRTMVHEDFPISVLEVVTSGLWRRIGPWGRIGSDLRARIDVALARVHLAGFERRAVATLSRGQLQRVLFARMLLQDAPLVLLDEPFTAVDSATTHHMLRLIHEINEAGTTVVAVLHDLDQVRSHFSQTLLLARHAIAWGPTGEVLGRDNLEAAQRLSEAWDEDAARCLWEDAA